MAPNNKRTRLKILLSLLQIFNGKRLIVNILCYGWTVKIKAQDSRFKVQGSKFICVQSSFVKGIKRAKKR